MFQKWGGETELCLTCIYPNSGSIKAKCLVHPCWPSVYVLNQCLLRERYEGIINKRIGCKINAVPRSRCCWRWLKRRSGRRWVWAGDRRVAAAHCFLQRVHEPSLYQMCWTLPIKTPHLPVLSVGLEQGFDSGQSMKTVEGASKLYKAWVWVRCKRCSI